MASGIFMDSSGKLPRSSLFTEHGPLQADSESIEPEKGGNGLVSEHDRRF
jgi:hypothetical protein